MTDFKLIHGIYESVINHALEERLSRLEENYAVTKNQLDSEESSFTLALHLTKLIACAWIKENLRMKTFAFTIGKP